MMQLSSYICFPLSASGWDLILFQHGLVYVYGCSSKHSVVVKDLLMKNSITFTVTVMQLRQSRETWLLDEFLPSDPFSALDRHRSFSADGRTNATTKHSTPSAIRAKPSTTKRVHWNLPWPQSSMMSSYCSDNSSSSETALPAARSLALKYKNRFMVFNLFQTAVCLTKDDLTVLVVTC